MSLQIGVNSEPPLVDVKKLHPIPEILCEVNEDKDKIRENIKSANNLRKICEESMKGLRCLHKTL